MDQGTLLQLRNVPVGPGELDGGVDDLPGGCSMSSGAVTKGARISLKILWNRFSASGACCNCDTTCFEPVIPGAGAETQPRPQAPTRRCPGAREPLTGSNGRPAGRSVPGPGRAPSGNRGRGTRCCRASRRPAWPARRCSPATGRKALPRAAGAGSGSAACTRPLRVAG